MIAMRINVKLVQAEAELQYLPISVLRMSLSVPKQ